MPAPTAADLFLKDGDSYVDLPGQPTTPGCRYERDFAALKRGVEPVAYARVSGEPGVNGIVLQYWLFYYFNDWNNKHEGDWEMIQLSFRANSAVAAETMDPDTVALTQHRSGEIARWNDAKLQREGSHVVVFVAKGSHSNYFRPHSYLGLGENGTGLGCDVASGERYRVEPQPVLLPHEPINQASPFAWLVYFGFWGQKESGQYSGPPGPHGTIRWYQPLTWQKTLRDSSAVIPAAGALGVDSLRSFCSGITLLGEGLSTYQRWPRIALGVAGASALCLAGLIFIAIRRAGRAGAVALEAHAGLRRRRNLSQILVHSALLYLQRLPSFLAIGALSIPSGLLAAALSSFLLTTPPLAGVVGLYEGNLPIRALIELQFGLLQLRIIYPFVLSAVAVEVAESGAGHELRALQAYRLALVKLPNVYSARLRALLVQLALCLTVIGIPLAAYLSVRWNFVEHAVIFDNVHGVAALDRSARLVGGNAWRVALVSLFVAVLLTVSLPLLAAIFLFTSPLSLSAINVIAGLLFAALVPYVTLCLTLFYFDLTVRAEANRERSPSRRSFAPEL